MAGRLLLLALHVALAGALPGATLAAPPVLLHDERDAYPLGIQLEILEDPGGALAVEDVASGAHPFVQAHREMPNLGISSSDWWVRFRVGGASRRGWLLELAWPITDHAELYTPVPGGGFAVQRAGTHHAPGTWPIASRAPTFVLPAADGEERTLLLRLRNENSLILPLTIWERDAFAVHERRETLVLGLLHGVLLLAGVAGLVFFWQLRDPLYLTYAGIVLGFGLWDAINDGLLFTYVWPAWWWSNRVLHLSIVVAVFSQVAFVRRFLDTRRLAPGLDRVAAFAMPAFPVLLVWPLLGAQQAFIRTSVFLAVFGIGWTLTIAVTCLARGSRTARFFLLAFSFLLVATVPYALRGLGLVPASPFTEHGLQFGIVLTSLTLWLGLADRIRATRAELERLNLSLEDRIRERTRALEEQSAALARASAVNKDFLATASHDLRQPLHALGLLVGALRSRVKSPEALGVVEQVQQSADGMSEMLDGLLDLSRLDAGLLEARVTDVPLAPLLSRLERELRPHAERKGLSLRVVASPLAVRSDPLLLRRIVQNLLANAIRYTDAGRVELDVTGENGSVRIDVADTGRGIRPGVQRRIFEPYARLEPEDEGAREGLGLGLAIVQRLALLLDHDLELASEPGRGSTFTVRAPRGLVDAPEPAAAPAEASFGGALVLAVDDDATILGGIRELLESWGCRVLTATSVKTAVAAIDASGEEPAALLADFRLGEGVTGVDAIRELRHKVGRELPALLVSADSAQETADHARRLGLILLRKPVAPLRLRAALHHVLRETR